MQLGDACKRWFDGQTCGLLSCSKPLSTDDDCAVVPTNEKKRVAGHALGKTPAKPFLINWVPNGRTALHEGCWARARSALKQRGLVNPQERQMIQSVEDIAEHYEGLPKTRASALQVAELVRAAQHVVAFTGAGISTAAGIPDYRGTAGVDARAELGQSDGPSAAEEEPEDGDLYYQRLRPTLAHRALAAMHRSGHLHYVVTQNCDDLHLKSGLPQEALSELHGNVFIEYCEKCERMYHRDYCVDLYSTDCYREPWYVKCPRCQWNHYTGRRCDVRGCRGRLRDTIVNFGDLLFENEVCGGLPRAERECAAADVVIALGSSLSVDPANGLVAKGRRLVLVNLQHTDFDRQAAVRVYASCDAFMALLAAELGVAIERADAPGTSVAATATAPAAAAAAAATAVAPRAVADTAPAAATLAGRKRKAPGAAAAVPGSGPARERRRNTGRVS